MALTANQVQGSFGKFVPALDEAGGTLTSNQVQSVFGKFVSVLDEAQVVAAADINIDKWLGSRPDVIFDKERNQYFYPSFTIDPSQLTLPETSFPDKWHVEIHY